MHVFVGIFFLYSKGWGIPGFCFIFMHVQLAFSILLYRCIFHGSDFVLLLIFVVVAVMGYGPGLAMARYGYGYQGSPVPVCLYFQNIDI